SAGVALVAGGGAVGFLGLTSLTNAPPQFGGFVPFQGGAISPPLYPRPNIAVSADNTDALVRGPLDLMALTITLVSTGYQFNITGYDGSLGYGSAVLRGHGAIAFDPSNAGRAILGQSPTANNIILITGLPKTITQTSTLLLSSTPRSIAITPNGSYAIVGADAGFYVVGGVDAGALMLQTPFAPSATSGSANSPAYVACDGSMRNLQNITSVAVTSNGKYIVLLGSAPGLSCLNGYNDTVVVLPFNQSNGSTPTPAPTPAPTTPPQGGATPAPTPTPVPTMFTQNNIVTQPANTDYMVVR
ncbi:MAG TPA: hypothetical protein VKG44_01400, partial [Candidatus Baltobacteraceae bacterium]|nr:hypothetical protein [Candidatus Baltobacteraceae bacterium]